MNAPPPAAPGETRTRPTRRGLPLFVLIAGYTVLSSVTVATVTGLLAIDNQRRVMGALHTKEVENELVTLSTLLDSYFDTRAVQLRDYANTPLLSQGVMQPEHLQPEVADFLDNLVLLGDQVPLLLLDFEGHALHATPGAPPAPSVDATVLRALIEDGAQQHIALVPWIGGYQWQLAVPVKHAGQAEGVLLAYISIHKIRELTRIESRIDHAGLHLVKDGTIVARFGATMDAAHSATQPMEHLGIELRYLVDHSLAQAASERLIEQLLLVFALTMSLFVVLSIALAKQVLVSPLRAFRDFADTLLEDSRPSTLDENQVVREFGFINGYFNEVAHRAWRNRQELADLNRELERRVNDRTSELKRANRNLRRMSNQDPLTRLANRRYLGGYLDTEFRRARRDGTTLTVMLIDVDHFKRYNDAYGHSLGDECLVKVAAALSRRLERPADLVARYGGEEFIVVLPGTGLDGAWHLAESVRESIETLHIPHEGNSASPWVTVSIGAYSVYVASTELSPAGLVERADQALYAAKEAGRNRAVVKGESPNVRRATREQPA